MALHSAIWILVLLILKSNETFSSHNVKDCHIMSEQSIKFYMERPGLKSGPNECLKIENELITSKEINFAKGREVDFKFNLRVYSFGENCINVFTYEVPERSSFQLKACSNNTEFLELKGYSTIKKRDADIIETKEINFKLLINHWYSITLTWKNDGSVLQITALKDREKWKHIDKIFFKTSSFNYFESGGYVSFGHFPKKDLQSKGKVIVWLDDFYVLATNVLKENENESLSEFDVQKGTENYWLSNRDMHVISNAGQYVHWSLCSSFTPFGNVNNDLITEESYTNASFAIEAEALCADLIYHDAMMSQCGNKFFPLTSQFFYLSCLNDCIHHGELSRAIKHLLEYATYCETYICVKTWLVYPLCDTLPSAFVPSRCHQQPEKLCYSGTLTEQGTCVCDRGWYGSSCLSVCPGGWDKPCGNVGKCDAVTGKCSCPINYLTASNCTTCADKFTGEDCSIYIKTLDDSLDQVVASAHGYSRMSMFNGISYDFPVAGYFYFMKSKFLTVALKQVSTNSPGGLLFYTEQVWVEMSNTNITIALPYISFEDKDPTIVILINGTKLNIKNENEHRMSLEDGSKLTKFSDSFVEIEIKKNHESNCKYFRVLKTLNMLNVYITCEKRDKLNTDFWHASALGGHPDVAVRTMDMKTMVNWQSVHTLAKLCSLPIKVGYPNFIHKNEEDTKKEFSNGNSLRFSNDKQPLYIVICKQLGNAVTPHDDVSFSFYVKKLSDGIFFSYKSNSDDVADFDLAFMNDTITIGNDEKNIWIDTGILVASTSSLTEWEKLYINCERSTGNIWMYYYGSESVESHLLTPNYLSALSTGRQKIGGSYWFLPDGSFILGGISDSPVQNLQPFSGIIDEIHIWDQALKHFLVYRNLPVKFHKMVPFQKRRSLEPKLRAVWNFDEGRGKLIRNLNPDGPSIVIQNRTRRAPISNLDHSLSWIRYEAPVIAFDIFFKYEDICDCTPIFLSMPLVVIDADSKWALEVCKSAVDSIANNKFCAKEVGRNHDLFLQQCIQDVIKLNSSAPTEITRLALSSLCRFTLNLNDPCLPNPCYNNGKCQVNGVDYKCVCGCGYTGKNCEIDIDECQSNPCLNSGLCRDEVCHYACECVQGYVGKTCHKECANPLGLESGLLSDSQMKASSVYQARMPWYLSYLAKNGRLNKKGWAGGWIPQIGDKAPWLQISFDEPMRITGVSIQGVLNWNGHETWTTSFKISSSEDNINWAPYGDIFDGNTDSESIIHREFHKMIKGQYFRIFPQSYNIRPGMRAELYGCPACDCCEELGMESFHIQNSQITASSVHGAENCIRCNEKTAAWPWFGRLDGPRSKYAHLDLWMAAKNDKCPWIMVDLLTPHNVNGVIVQGGSFYRYSIYTTEFQVNHSADNLTWTQLDKVFEGNHNSVSHRKIVFDNSFQARYVKVVLTDWNVHPGIKIEILGCSTDEVA